MCSSREAKTTRTSKEAQAPKPKVFPSGAQPRPRILSRVDRSTKRGADACLSLATELGSSEPTSSMRTHDERQMDLSCVVRLGVTVSARFCRGSNCLKRSAPSALVCVPLSVLSRQTTWSMSSSHQVVRRNSCAMQLLQFAVCILSDDRVSHSRLHARTHAHGASCYWSELRPIPTHLICRPGRTVGKKGGHLHQTMRRRSSHFALLELANLLSACVDSRKEMFMRGEWGAGFITFCTAAERG